MPPSFSFIFDVQIWDRYQTAHFLARKRINTFIKMSNSSFKTEKRLNLIHFLFFSQCNCLLFISIHWISSYRNFLFLFVALCGVFSLLPVLSSTFTFFCYICVKSTLYLGQYNFYTGSSLTVQTSVPNEFQSVRDFFYGVISYNWD